MLNRIYYLLGRVLESKKKWELALNFYLKVPHNTTVNYRRAFCYKQRKDYGNAVYFFKKAISEEKNKAHWYLNLAESLSFLDKENEALNYINLGLNLNHNNTINYQKQIERISKKINQAIPNINPSIENIRRINVDNIEIKILGKIEKSPNNIIEIELRTRKNSIDILPYSHIITLDNITIDKENIFEAKVIIPLTLLSINNDIINHVWDFYLIVGQKKFRLQYFKADKELLKFQNFDFIPYRTLGREFSILSIRKNSTIQKNYTKNITLVIPNIDEDNFFTQNIIKLANILTTLNYKVTLLALHIKVNQNHFHISTKINFDYISSPLLSEKIEKIDFTSSNIIPSKEYNKIFNNYFKNLQTDILYLPILGEFFFNRIISLSNNSIIKIVGEYNKKRYISYLNLIQNNDKISIETIIEKVQTKHFFTNIDKISAIHIIYPETKTLFTKISNKKIIASSNEENLIQEWKDNLVEIINEIDEDDTLFY
jgi:tetratricopeptide (TPR) repeat protein